MEALVVASKEIGLEVNSDKTEFMVMCGVQRMQNEVTVRILIIVLLKGWMSSDIGEQP